MESERIAVAETQLADVKEDTVKILLILEGNGHDGLVTKTALNQQSIKRLWWFVGITTTAFVLGGVAMFWKAAEILACLPAS